MLFKIILFSHMAALQKLKETLSGKGGGWEKEEAVAGINVAACV